MAKDGTMRGGQRWGAGHPVRPAVEKINDGNPGGRPIMVMDLPEPPDLLGEEMPKPKEYLTQEQRNGIDLCAVEVYEETWQWLQKCGCEKLVNPGLVDQYAMSVARYIQCETAISMYGPLAKHPTTGNPIASPYVSMSQTYQKQASQIWYQINQVVKENCTSEYGSGPGPGDDMMEVLLRMKGG